jgi:heme o synthase
VALASRDSLITALSRPGWREYLSLTKPKVTLLIVFTAIAGMVLAALVLDARFLYMALALYRGKRPDLPIRTFRFSITYLMALFGAFIADHYCRLIV